MSDLSYFESRSGNVTCSVEKLFAFITDLRNFERFVPSKGAITNCRTGKDFCSFNVSVVGTVSLRLTRQIRYNKVVFNGDALKKNDFELVLHITGGDNTPASVRIILNADLNPMMKMMAVKPIGQFLELLIKEMENFRGWEDTIE